MSPAGVRPAWSQVRPTTALTHAQLYLYINGYPADLPAKMQNSPNSRNSCLPLLIGFGVCLPSPSHCSNHSKQIESHVGKFVAQKQSNQIGAKSLSLFRHESSLSLLGKAMDFFFLAVHMALNHLVEKQSPFPPPLCSITPQSMSNNKSHKLFPYLISLNH